MTDTTADGWTYNEDRDNILDQDGFAPDITTEQWRTLLHFIATHGPAIVAGRDPVADAECERDEARAAVEELQSRVCVLENECAAAEQESFDSDEQARADMAKIAELEAAMAEVERLRTLCAEVYQVVAVLAGDHFDTPRVERVLDNLAAATGGEALPHENLTPFVVAGPVMPAAEPARHLTADECRLLGALKAAHDANERDRTRIADAIYKFRKVLQQRSWLAGDGMGSYAYDEIDQFKTEFGDAMRDLDGVLADLKKVAADWEHCPQTWAETQAARAALAPQPAAQPGAEPWCIFVLRDDVLRAGADLTETIGDVVIRNIKAGEVVTPKPGHTYRAVGRQECGSITTASSADPVMPAPSERVATIAAIEDIEELATARAQRIGPMMPEEPGLVARAEIACGINNALKRGGGQTITQETRHIYRAIRAALAKEQQQ